MVVEVMVGVVVEVVVVGVRLAQLLISVSYQSACHVGRKCLRLSWMSWEGSGEWRLMRKLI